MLFGAALARMDRSRPLLVACHFDADGLGAGAAMAEARRVAPRLAGEVAPIPLDSPCQIHPLIAQQWRTRLKGRLVIAADGAYQPGWVHFSARTGGGHDFTVLLAAHRPPGAAERFGNGHRAASGGALREAGRQ